MIAPGEVFVDPATQPCVCYVKPTTAGNVREGEHCGCTRSGARQTSKGPRAFTIECDPSEVRTDDAEDDEPDVDLVERTVRVRASARFDDGSDPVTSWANLDAFDDQHPIPVLFDHNAKCSLGTATVERVDADGTFIALVRFDAAGMADTVLHGCAEGIWRAVSLGITRLGDRASAARTARVREISFVTIGRDPDALVVRRPRRDARSSETQHHLGAVRADAKKENTMTTDSMIAAAKAKNAKTLANMWKPSAEAAEAAARFDAAEGRGPIRDEREPVTPARERQRERQNQLRADAQRARLGTEGARFDADDEDERARVFDAEVDAAERKLRAANASVRNDAVEAEVSGDLIAIAKRKVKAFRDNAWKAGVQG